jgi:cobalt/nickel transport system permease protein
MALVGALGGYALFLVVRRLLPRSNAGVVLAAGFAAACAPAMAALMFTAEYAVGGNGAAPLRTVATAMIGVHTIIGLGEGVITAMAVSVVVATRPDLVHGASRLRAARRTVLVAVEVAS